MPLPIPAQWGRPLDSYASAYKLNQKPQMGLTSIDTEIEGLQAVQKIIEKTQSNQGDLWDLIDLSVLNSALKLALDVDTMSHLANVSLVGSCVRLIRAIKPSGIVSPLSYEYGYLSFRLLLQTINTCLLERFNALDQARSKRAKGHTKSAFDIVSDCVASIVLRYFDAHSRQLDYDSALGWTSVPRPRQKPPILSRFEALALLDILWADRKQFLRVLASTIMPGISGSIFLLFRFISQSSHAKSESTGEMFDSMLYELAMRYLLLAEKGELMPIICILDGLQDVTSHNSVLQVPKNTDADDSRLILKSYIQRLSRVDKSLFMAKDEFMIQGFVVICTDIGSQKLLPQTIRSTIEFTWSLLQSKQVTDHVKFLLAAFSFIHMFIKNPCRPYPLDYAVQSEIIDMLLEQDVLDLTARTLILLKPGSAIPSAPEAQQSQITRSVFLRCFDSISNLLTKRELKERFKIAAQDWWKLRRHLLMIRLGVLSRTPIDYQEYYELCMKIWEHVRQSLGMEYPLVGYDTADCSSGRCPRAYQIQLGQRARFGCNGCGLAMYCDARCQAMGWEFGDGARPHREICQGYQIMLAAGDE